MSEVIITIDGVEYKAEGHTLRPSSTDPRGEVLRRLDSIEATQATVVKRLDNMGTQMALMRQEVAGLPTSVYWVLGAIGIFIAGLAIPAFVLSMIGLINNSKHIVREMLPEIKN